jgi:hypothetical protein
MRIETEEKQYMHLIYKTAASLSENDEALCYITSTH